MDKKFADRLDWELTRASDTRDSRASDGHHDKLPERPRQRELDTEQALTVAAELGRLGCRVVTLCGPEPTLRADWPQIAQVLARAGVRVKLITSGHRFGRLEARLARAAGVSRVLLRLDEYVTAPEGDRRRQAFGQLEIAATGLRDADVPMGLLTTVGDQSPAQRERLVSWVSRWQPEVQQSAHCGPARRDDLSVSRDRDAVETAPTRCCEAGRDVLGLRSDGTITECLALPDGLGVGNVRHSPLPQLWRAAQKARRQRMATSSPALAALTPQGKERARQDRGQKGAEGRYSSRSNPSETELMQ